MSQVSILNIVCGEANGHISDGFPMEFYFESFSALKEGKFVCLKLFIDIIFKVTYVVDAKNSTEDFDQ